jgi:hypothetical protein
MTSGASIGMNIQRVLESWNASYHTLPRDFPKRKLPGRTPCCFFFRPCVEIPSEGPMPRRCLNLLIALEYSGERHAVMSMLSASAAGVLHHGRAVRKPLRSARDLQPVSRNLTVLRAYERTDSRYTHIRTDSMRIFQKYLHVVNCGSRGVEFQERGTICTAGRRAGSAYLPLSPIQSSRAEAGVLHRQPYKARCKMFQDTWISSHSRDVEICRIIPDAATQEPESF